ncbi:peptidase family c78 protein [Cryptosporidium felis]|nr:peptidase family c78 protein [Cryptosporidium felis]
MSNGYKTDELQSQLYETKNRMEQERDRFLRSEQALTQDGDSILQANLSYKQYGEKLAENISRFSRIKKRSELETLFWKELIKNKNRLELHIIFEIFFIETIPHFYIMPIVEELENLKIYILESLFERLNRLDITQDEIGEPINAKYFVVGYLERSRGSEKLIIISDVLKLNLQEWNKSVIEFIEDIVITLPKGFSVIGLLQSKSDCSEWLKIRTIEFDNCKNKCGIWDPNEYFNFVIVPKSDDLSIITSMKIFLVGKDANYLIPNTRISIMRDFSEFGEFYCSEVQISLPMLTTNYSHESELDSNISLIKEIIETNLVVKTQFSSINDEVNVYNFNKNHKIDNNLNTPPIQVPVFFSQSIQLVDNNIINDNSIRNDNIGKYKSHFFTSYTITNKDEKSIHNINLHLQACIFGPGFNEDVSYLQRMIKKCFIDQCNYILLRAKNPTSLFYLSDSNSIFEFYLFKIPQVSLPIILLNTGVLSNNNLNQKALRKLWSDIFNIKPLIPLITKDLALIPKPRNDISQIAIKCYNEKLVSPHKVAIERAKSKNSNSNDLSLDIESDLELDLPLNIKRASRSPIIYQILGDFYYYHYNQDNFNDQGWGCTYRSLQMLLSWYLINNYTNKHVLSITEIQEFLKKNDSTYNNLQIGSNTLIGTVEASYILIMYLGISCKLKYYYNIEEFLRNYDLISNHFQNISSPIIISIGDYSYLLTGIQISKDPSSPFKLDNVHYLLVDPHYIGKDDLDSIYKKNGVSWKSSKFFKSVSKGKYVNVLFPLNISEKTSQIIY